MSEVTFNLTEKELKVAKILTDEALAGMGGDRPMDFDDDEYTWVDVDMLVAHDYTLPEAKGYFSSLIKKGFIDQDVDGEGGDCLSWNGWHWMDTQWDRLTEED